MNARTLVAIWALATTVSSMTAGCSRADSSPEIADGRDAEDDATGAPDANGDATSDSAMGGLPDQYPFRVLQLNLCNSGFAGCYDNGLAIPEGGAAIKAAAPDVVTLNEICQDDLAQLSSAMTVAFPGRTVVSAFKAAGDRRTNAPYKCKNGQDYGIGLVVHVPGNYVGHKVVSGLYASQDTSSAEQRAWLCIEATDSFYACTTHLATIGSVAMSQCKDLMNNIIPSVRGSYAPTVVGADLNLKFAGSPNAQECVPSGYFRKGDGDVQHILATTDFTFSSSSLVAMTHTDHDGWFVALTAP